jgi:hypothetical protein
MVTRKTEIPAAPRRDRPSLPRAAGRALMQGASWFSQQHQNSAQCRSWKRLARTLARQVALMRLLTNPILSQTGWMKYNKK